MGKTLRQNASRLLDVYQDVTTLSMPQAATRETISVGCTSLAEFHALPSIWKRFQDKLPPGQCANLDGRFFETGTMGINELREGRVAALFTTVGKNDPHETVQVQRYGFQLLRVALIPMLRHEEYEKIWGNDRASITLAQLKSLPLCYCEYQEQALELLAGSKLPRLSLGTNESVIAHVRHGGMAGLTVNWKRVLLDLPEGVCIKRLEAKLPPYGEMGLCFSRARQQSALFQDLKDSAAEFFKAEELIAKEGFPLRSRKGLLG
jgi:DNA-binding transcriptional LysR family regulator